MVHAFPEMEEISVNCTEISGSNTSLLAQYHHQAQNKKVHENDLKNYVKATISGTESERDPTPHLEILWSRK